VFRQKAGSSVSSLLWTLPHLTRRTVGVSESTKVWGEGWCRTRGSLWR